jgi:hypothetical protein
MRRGAERPPARFEKTLQLCGVDFPQEEFWDYVI